MRQLPGRKCLRDSLVAGLTVAPDARAQVLRQVAESEEFALNRVEPCFVTMVLRLPAA